MDTLDSGHANGFIGLKGVYKSVYLSMSEKLPCFKFTDISSSWIFFELGVKILAVKKTDVLDASPCKDESSAYSQIGQVC